MITTNPPGERSLYWDTVIEVIDPFEERVIASTRFDICFRDFADAQHVFAYREDDTGKPLIDLFRLAANSTTTGGPR
jgi:hypothetical protein